MKKVTEIVIMGGGTGIYPVTKALKSLEVDISTIIAVSDSGGSTGRIRDEFGFQPVGDLRQSLAALAEGDKKEWIGKLLLYRFSKGNGLKGHNLGNLILTALQDMTGSTTQALEIASKIFRLNGKVIPVTEEITDIEITYEDDTKILGEDYLNPESNTGKNVKSIALKPKAKINPLAAQKIKTAKQIIIGPGDYYASLLATLLPEGIKAAFKQSSAKVSLIVNLMSRHMQTDTMKASDYVAGIEAHIGKKIDRIIINSGNISPQLLTVYKKHHEFPVADDLQDDNRVERADIISSEEVEFETADDLQRSYLRHDSEKLAKLFTTLL